MKKKFKVPIYGFTVEVVIVENEHKTTEYLEKLLKKLKRPSEGEGSCEGVVFVYGLKAWLIISKNHLSINTITHEVAHLTYKILNFNNIFTGEDNEQHALLNGFLNEEVDKIIKKYKCKTT